MLYVGKTYPHYEEFNRKILSLNLKIEKMCKEQKIEFLNLNSILAKENILKEEYSFDGIHLTYAGYKEWAKVISPILDRYTK